MKCACTHGEDAESEKKFVLPYDEYEPYAVHDTILFEEIAGELRYRKKGSGSHENGRPFKVISMEKEEQTSLVHQLLGD